MTVKHVVARGAAMAALALSFAEGADPKSPNLADLSLEQLMEIDIPTVAAASRHEEKSTLAPASVTVVTADEIQRYGWRTLADVLRATAGFYTSYDYSYDYVGLRGFLRPGDLNTRFLLLVDGHRVNDNIYGQAAFGTEGVIDLAEVERIEIVRGPASALYGSSAFFGTISVVTRSGGSVGGVEARLGARSAETYEGGVSYGHAFASGADLLLAVSGAHSGGERLYFPAFDAPETNHGITEGTDDETFHRILAKVSWPNVDIEAVSSRREKGIPTGAFGMPFNDSRARTVDTWSHLAFTHRNRLSPAWELEARLGVDDYRYTGVYPTDTVVNEDQTHGNSWGLDVRALGVLGSVHTLTIGAEYRDDWRLDQKNFDQDPYVLTYDKHGSDHVAAVYVQDQLRLHERVRLDLGVRYDDYGSFGGTTNPRFAVIWMPDPRLALKALYGTAFRAPTAFELFFAPDRLTGDFEANKELEPETVTTSELAGEWYASRHVRVTGSIYRYVVEDLIRLAYDPETGMETSGNVDHVTSTGGELGVFYENGSHGQFALTYATADAEDDNTGQHLTNSPRHLVRSRFAVPLFESRFTPALEVQWESGRETLAGNTTGSRVLANLTLNAKVAARVDVSAGATNLFDQAYEEPASDSQAADTLPQRGRQYWVKVRARF